MNIVWVDVIYVKVVKHLPVDDMYSLHPLTISVPNWFIMHLFCSRCKNRPSLHHFWRNKPCQAIFNSAQLQKQPHSCYFNLTSKTTTKWEYHTTYQPPRSRGCFHSKIIILSPKSRFLHYSCTHSFKRLAGVVHWQEDSTTQHQPLSSIPAGTRQSQHMPWLHMMLFICAISTSPSQNSSKPHWLVLVQSNIIFQWGIHLNIKKRP